MNHYQSYLILFDHYIYPCLPEQFSHNLGESASGAKCLSYASSFPRHWRLDGEWFTDMARHGASPRSHGASRRQSRRSEVTFDLCSCRLKEWTNHRDTERVHVTNKNESSNVILCIQQILHSAFWRLTNWWKTYKAGHLASQECQNKWARIMLTLWPYLVYSGSGPNQCLWTSNSWAWPNHSTSWRSEQRRWLAWSKCSQSESTILRAWSFRGIPK